MSLENCWRLPGKLQRFLCCRKEGLLGSSALALVPAIDYLIAKTLLNMGTLQLPAQGVVNGMWCLPFLSYLSGSEKTTANAG